MRSTRAAVLWIIGAAVGAAFLWLAVRAIDLRAALAIARQADLPDVLVIVVCALAFAGVKALRWNWLIAHLGPVPPRRLLGPVLAGTAVNYGVPHGGELVRAWMLARREGLSTAALLASIAVERLFDFCAALLLGLVALLAGRALLDTLGATLWVLLAFIVLILAAALPFVARPEVALRVSRALLGPLPGRARAWAVGHLERGIEGVGALRQGSTVAKVLGVSLLQWVLMAACAWLSLRAVGVAPDPVHAVVTLLLLVVGLTLPAAPGHVGTTQVAFLLAAAPFGVGPEEAIAASFVYNVFVPLPLIVAGVGALLGDWNGAGLARRRPPN